MRKEDYWISKNGVQKKVLNIEKEVEKWRSILGRLSLVEVEVTIIHRGIEEVRRRHIT